MGFFAALVGALWAYDGWNNVTMVASEVRKPQRNLPLALIVGTLAVIAIYLLTNLAYFYVLPAGTVASTDRVAAEMMRRILGAPGAAAVSVAAMISIFRGAQWLHPVRLASAFCDGARRAIFPRRGANSSGSSNPQRFYPALKRLGLPASAQRAI